MNDSHNMAAQARPLVPRLPVREKKKSLEKKSQENRGGNRRAKNYREKEKGLFRSGGRGEGGD